MAARYIAVRCSKILSILHLKNLYLEKSKFVRKSLDSGTEIGRIRQQPSGLKGCAGEYQNL